LYVDLLYNNLASTSMPIPILQKKCVQNLLPANLEKMLIFVLTQPNNLDRLMLMFRNKYRVNSEVEELVWVDVVRYLIVCHQDYNTSYLVI
jgi:hypothetical protein